MSEQQTLLSGWPDWARMALFLTLLPFFVLAVVFGKSSAIFLLCGLVMLVQMWVHQHFGGYTRTGSPVLFWAAVVIFCLMAARGGFELYQDLAGAPV
ncbi:MAG: hypothetical protein AAF692_00580 [Pseudomonadota bacterium]